MMVTSVIIYESYLVFIEQISYFSSWVLSPISFELLTCCSKIWAFLLVFLCRPRFGLPASFFLWHCRTRAPGFVSRCRFQFAAAIAVFSSTARCSSGFIFSREYLRRQRSPPLELDSASPGFVLRLARFHFRVLPDSAFAPAATSQLGAEPAKAAATKA
jgi:hypothetical protein